MQEFKKYHPVVTMVYLVAVIGFSMFLLHPVCLCIGLVSSITYSLLLCGKKAVKLQLFFLLPAILITALMNPAFNHAGVTVLTYLPSGNPLTLESILYGFAAGGMLITVISWFFCYQQIMTSDKFIYLFGRIIPSLSLVFSMTLRFVPRFLHQTKIVVNVQRCMGKDVTTGKIKERCKHAMNILSIMITWALENAIETADSMKSRGYGLTGRTAFSIYRFRKRDGFVLCSLLFLIGYLITGILLGQTKCAYFPALKLSPVTPYAFTVFFSYFLLCTLPVLLELWEVKQWNSIKSNN